MSHSRRVAAIVLLTSLLGAWACQRDGAAEAPSDQFAQAATPSEGITAGPNYTISHLAADVPVSEPGQIELRVTPAPGFKINIEYPWLLTLEAEEAMAVPQTDWDRSGATSMADDEAVYQVPVIAEAAGSHRVNGHLRFSVCNEARCDVLQADLAWSVSAE